MSSQALDNRKALYKDASCKAKAFRRQAKNEGFSTDEMEERRRFVYGIYADAMNDLEHWTGENLLVVEMHHRETNSSRLPVSLLRNMSMKLQSATEPAILFNKAHVLQE